MLKKIVAGMLVVILLAFVGGFFWARSVLTGDNVRATLAAQVSAAIGQPVTIGSISAGIFPRVTVNLGEVRIGEPARVQIDGLHVGTDLRALLSRRIEHASLRLTGARVELPLPPLKTSAPSQTGAGEQPSGSLPVQLVSIDEIVLNDVQIVSGGRTLRGDVEVVPQGQGLVVRKVLLGAADTTITATGQITNLSGPVGELTVKAGTLDFEQLLAFVNDFSTGAGGPEAQHPPGGAAPQASPQSALSPGGMNLTVSLEADRATMGKLALEKLSGRARLTAQAVTLDPIGFGVFGGRYEGSLTLAPDGGSLSFRLISTLAGINVAAATRFAGSPDSISGRLAGKLDIAGRGSDQASIVNSARGTARIDITDGTVKNLGLVRSIVVATSMRSGATAESSGSKDEPFSRLGATLKLANGGATTDDLRFESKDLILTAQGGVQLSAATVDLKGRVQLSDALSQQAGRGLVRYTQDQGRVTVPARVTGSAEALHVNVDAGDMAKRAVRNAANEQAQKAQEAAQKAVSKRLGGLFGR